MSDRMALKAAIDLMLVPSQVRFVRAEPLPEGLLWLLRIAAGDEQAERAAAVLMDRSREVVRRAATFFIEQILFAPDADSYQVLGANPQASNGELRRNMALLLRWLHPDLDPRGERSVFIDKVTASWNDLKTPERRAAYDAIRLRSANGKARSTWSSRQGTRRQLGNGSQRQSPRVKYAQFPDRWRKKGFLRCALSALLLRPMY